MAIIIMTILVGLLEIVFTQNSAVASSYDFQKDIKVIRNQDWLLSSFRLNDKITCLAKCNSNINCATVVFSEIDLKNDYNCLLYRKYFSPDLLQSFVGSMIFIKKCALVTTYNNTVCAKKPQMFFDWIGNNQPKYSISSHPGGSFGMLHGLVEHFDGSEYMYYVSDFFNNQILKYNEKWEYQLTVAYIHPSNGLSLYSELFIAFDNYIRKFDGNLTVLDFYFKASTAYRGICYDYINDMLYATDQTGQTIETFNRNLTILNVFTAIGYSPFALNFINGLLIVGSYSVKNLYFVRDSIIEKNLTTLCTNDINSIDFDGFGYFAALCYSNARAYIYDLNGNYTGKFYVGQVQINSRKILFDSKGRLVVLSRQMINIYY